MIFIEENAPRDGLQNEKLLLSPEERVELVHELSACGFQRIQVGSFVNSRLVPQMAETEEVFQRIRRRVGVVYSALVLSGRGLERARACGVEHVSLFTSASEAHSLKNSNCTVKEGVERARTLIEKAKSFGMMVQAGVMNAFGCRMEGAVSPRVVVELVKELVQDHADEISLADTSGLANPVQIEAMISRMADLTDLPLSLHLHDTYGFGMANVYAAWKAGVTRFDACCGGLGGCPFVPEAAGNIPTEDMVHLFESMSVPTGIDLRRLAGVVRNLESRLGRSLPGRYARLSAGRGEE